MSYENSKLKTLVEEIVDSGSKASTSTILYHLFDGDDVAEAFEDTSFKGVAENDWSGYRAAADEYLKGAGYTHIEMEGGGEGGSEYCYGVIKIGDEYYKAEWSYYSYQGHDYDYIENTIKSVKPVQKMVTVYE